MRPNGLREQLAPCALRCEREVVLRPYVLLLQGSGRQESLTNNALTSTDLLPSLLRQQ